MGILETEEENLWNRLLEISTYRKAPGDSKWPFDPLVRGHLTFPKGHLTIPKRSPAELPGISFFCFFFGDNFLGWTSFIIFKINFDGSKTLEFGHETCDFSPRFFIFQMKKLHQRWWSVKSHTSFFRKIRVDFWLCLEVATFLGMV